MAASADTHEPARKTADLASAGASIMTLLNEQARQAIETHTTIAIGRARTLAEIAQVQGAFITGSVERMERFNACYLAFVRGLTRLVSVPSSRR